MLKLIVMLLLICNSAQAFLVTLKSETPLLTNINIRVVTVYDPHNFTGFLTQGIEYFEVRTRGMPFRIHWEKQTDTFADAMSQHEVCKFYMMSVFMTATIAARVPVQSPPSPPLGQDDDDDIIEIQSPHSTGYISSDELQPIPEEKIDWDEDGYEFNGGFNGNYFEMGRREGL